MSSEKLCQTRGRPLTILDTITVTFTSASTTTTTTSTTHPIVHPLGNHLLIYQSISLRGFSYRESAVRLSKFIKRLPRSPVSEAADWIEYTQAVGGLQHLQPRGLDLPLYKYYFLDVLLLFFVTTVLMFFILKYLGGSLWLHLRASAATTNLESEKNIKKME